MLYSGACSEKYFREVMASGHAWISSNITRVSESMRSLLTEARSDNILCGSRFLANSRCISLSDSKFTYTVFLKFSFPNSVSMYVLPHWRTPLRIRGILSSFSFHPTSSREILRHMIE